jgi:hypothetical protein
VTNTATEPDKSKSESTRLISLTSSLRRLSQSLFKLHSTTGMGPAFNHIFHPGSILLLGLFGLEDTCGLALEREFLAGWREGGAG